MKCFALILTLGLALAFTGCSGGTNLSQPQQLFDSPKSATASTTTGTATTGLQYDRVYVGQDALNSAIDTINHAKSNIDLDMYEFTNPTILDALKNAKHRGVQERIVLDESSSKAASTLQQAGIPVHVVQVSGGINHVKYLNVDNKSVLLGSVNFGKGSGMNEDASVWVPFKDDEKSFFDTVWARNEPSINGPTLFNSVNTQQEAIQLIQSAKKSIVVGMFAWTDSQTINAVIDAKRRGLSVTAYIDGHQSENRSTIRRLNAAGVHVVVAHTSQWLHLKGLVVDDQTTLMGSANWSYHSFHENHELNFVTTTPSVAQGILNLLATTNQ